MKIALIHDWLIGLGGAERVLEAIHELYPAPIHTLLKNNKPFKEGVEVHTSWMQGIPGACRFYRHLLPLFPLAIESFDLAQYDVILSSSHAVAKGVIKNVRQLHLCYCHTPMRYAWDLNAIYLEAMGKWKQPIARLLLQRMRKWDEGTVPRVDHFIANSEYVRARIKQHYQRDAKVIYPPVDVDRMLFKQKKDSFYVTVSRLVPYKKIALIVEAFRKMPDKKLVVIGDGPELSTIQKKAEKNIEILGFQPDYVVKDYLANARAFVFAALEDFGIAPVEAQGSGTPVIAYGQGGVLETVHENKTGIFFPQQNSASLIQAVEKFEEMEYHFDPHVIREHAQRFSRQRFQSEFKRFVQEKIEAFNESRDPRGR